MDGYTRTTFGPGGIASLSPTIGMTSRAPTIGAEDRGMPIAPAFPMQPAFPVKPAKPVLSGLLGLLGLGNGNGTTTPIWQQAWFPYAALGALGVGLYFVIRSKQRESMSMERLFENPDQSGSGRRGVPDDAPTVVQSLFNLMSRSADANGVSVSRIAWSQDGNNWSIGDGQGELGDIVVRPKGDHWVAYHRTAMGDRKLSAREGADMARDFFEMGAYEEAGAY